MKNKSKSNLLLALVILAALTLSCTFITDRFASGTKVSFSDADIKTFDPKAPLVSPGAMALRRLAEMDPSLADRVASVEAAERTALTKGRDEVNKLIVGVSIEKSSIQLTRHGVDNSGHRPASAALMYLQSARPAASPVSVQDAGLIASLVGGLKHGLMSDAKAGTIPNTRPSFTETVDGATTTVSIEIGSTSDGSTTFGITGKTESVKSGVKVTTEFEGKIEGSECPNAEGQIQLNVKIRLGAGSAANGFTQDLTTFVRATVNENADISSITMDVAQATHQYLGGRTIFVETGETYKADGPSMSTAVSSNLTTRQRTDNATNEEVGQLSAAGHTAAGVIGDTALRIAENNWQNGGCVEIDAKSPGSVAANSATEIPAKVDHKIEGGEIPSKLDATLTGGVSIVPATIAKTAGTLTYLAPGESGKSATIHLAAA